MECGRKIIVMTSPRVFFYVQHLLGIGHLKRAAAIARALVAAGAEVDFVLGGAPVAGIAPQGVRVVQLPPAIASALVPMLFAIAVCWPVATKSPTSILVC